MNLRVHHLDHACVDNLYSYDDLYFWLTIDRNKVNDNLNQVATLLIMIRTLLTKRYTVMSQHLGY